MRTRPAALTFGTAVVAGVALMALVAPWIAPNDPAEQLDPATGHHLPPGTHRWAVQLTTGRWLLAESVERTETGIVIVRDGKTHMLGVAEVANLTPNGVADERRFALGTDHLGRDVLSRLLHASRASMLVGLLAVALALTLGVAVGSAAAMGGGWVDGVLMRGVDALLAMPRLFLILLVTSLARPDPLVVVLVLGGTGWMQISRLTRAQLLTLRGSEMEVAARATGQHPLRIFIRHLLPNALTPLIVDVSLRIGDLILIEAALSFLGLGIQPPVASWGNMIADGSTALRTAWWVATPAAVATTLTVMGFNLLGDGLRDRLDPRTAPRA
jgi:peptide/nickel transport system permease protein